MHVLEVSNLKLMTLALIDGHHLENYTLKIHIEYI